MNRNKISVVMTEQLLEKLKSVCIKVKEESGTMPTVDVSLIINMPEWKIVVPNTSGIKYISSNKISEGDLDNYLENRVGLQKLISSKGYAEVSYIENKSGSLIDPVLTKLLVLTKVAVQAGCRISVNYFVDDGAYLVVEIGKTSKTYQSKITNESYWLIDDIADEINKLPFI